MRPLWRTSVAAGLAVAVTAATTLASAAPAAAATDGGARADVVVSDLDISTYYETLLHGVTRIEYGSPETPGSTGAEMEPFTMDGYRVDGGGLIRRATASREADLLSASVDVEDFRLDLFDVNAISFDRISSTVRCPTFGTPTAETTISGLTFFGEPVELVPNGPAVTRSSPVVVPTISNAQLHLTLRRTETPNAFPHSSAAPMEGTLSFTGIQFDGRPFGQVAGLLSFGAGVCEQDLPIPVITAISPDSGPETGDRRVTITGENFAPGHTTVTFGGRSAYEVTVAPDRTSLTLVTPSHDVGPVPVEVTTPGGTSAPGTYTYQYGGVYAQVRNVIPNSGPTAGGTEVAINGVNFVGATGVTFGGIPGTDFTINPAGTRITVVTPANDPGPVPVTLVFPAGTATAPQFTYLAPTVTGVSPTQGPTSGGTRVTIGGTGLDRATGVTFGGIPGTDLSTGGAEATLSVTTPPGPVGPVDVVVELPGPDATVPAGFRYLLAAPTVTTVDPDRGPTSGGTRVTVGGSGFVPGQTTVTSCGRVIVPSSVTVAPDGLSLTFATPPCTAGSSTITVTTPAGTSAPTAFRYVNGGLPVTGTPGRTLLALALALIALGTLTVVVIRRRTAHSFTA